MGIWEISFFVTAFCIMVVISLTIVKVGIPIAKVKPDQLQLFEMGYLIIGINALFLTGSDSEETAKQLGLNSILKLLRFLWLMTFIAGVTTIIISISRL